MIEFHGKGNVQAAKNLFLVVLGTGNSDAKMWRRRADRTREIRLAALL